MIFRYKKEDWKDLKTAENNRFIQGNGLGGYIASTAAFSVSRCDDGILCSSVQVPNVRKLLVHRLKETLHHAGRDTILSMQRFADGTEEGQGLIFLDCFEVDALPVWNYQVGDITVRRTCAVLYGKNASVVCYELENRSRSEAEWTVDPGFLMSYKGEPVKESGRVFDCEILSQRPADFEKQLLFRAADCEAGSENSCHWKDNIDTVSVSGGKTEEGTLTSVRFSAGDIDQRVRIFTDGAAEITDQREDCLAYPDDGKDGRPEKGYEMHGVQIHWWIPAGEKRTASILFSMEQEQDTEENLLPANRQVPAADAHMADGFMPSADAHMIAGALSAADAHMIAESVSAADAYMTDGDSVFLSLLMKEKKRRETLLNKDLYQDETAQELCRAADLFLSEKESTKGSTLIAGYPLFGDWGRDTMISLPGCILSVGKYEEAKEIFRTFLKYEKNGLVPNLFPEKGKEPWYNSVDAPLLLIEGLKLYVDRTADWAFIEEQYEVLKKIILAYREGTDFNIHMDTDFLIAEGELPWQLTWMDACIDGILPTPRYGKPVEINAFWYNALMIMAEFAGRLGRREDRKKYSDLAANVKKSFNREFWLPKKGYLKDLVSEKEGNPADLQIRCNQIWTLTLSYTMLTKSREQKVLKTVREKLYTPYGLRTLAPDDPEYKGYYGGPQFDRDMAYHQGTIWVYPMGAWYRAVLKVGEYSEEAVAEVKKGLEKIPDMLREGCAGQLPEIYDGDTPGESKGCYAQCWSVGEILRVYEELEKAEQMLRAESKADC